MLSNALHHHLGRQHLIHSPAIAIAHIHLFDQAQFHPLTARQLRQGDQLIVVHTPLNHRIELEVTCSWIEPSGSCSDQTSQHLLHQSILKPIRER